ncbi:hypothetical protein EVAR_70478_1 [Eumeta japonica]|uniref:Uncharacterized protein n=1 Tax=Eumeta variegata TaxID=151549 RepID=A0A4C1SFQ4_EUMVA|nr:hypothetical protein EVAR_70478_1 [Eumeta japonica]
MPILRASIRQSRADGIPCRSAATNEVLKVPNYWDYGQRPTIRSLRGFASLQVNYLEGLATRQQPAPPAQDLTPSTRTHYVYPNGTRVGRIVILGCLFWGSVGEGKKESKSVRGVPVSMSNSQ